MDAVHDDLIESIETGTSSSPDFAPVVFERGEAVSVSGSSYLQVIDLESLADWAVKHGARVKLLVRPGEYVQSASQSQRFARIGTMPPTPWSAL